MQNSLKVIQEINMCFSLFLTQAHTHTYTLDVQARSLSQTTEDASLISARPSHHN